MPTRRACSLLAAWALLGLSSGQSSAVAQAGISPAVSMGLPPPPGPAPTKVYAQVEFSRISSLNMQSQSIYAGFSLILSWVDESVNTSLPFSMEQSFFPDVTFTNLIKDDTFAEPQYQFYYGYPPQFDQAADTSSSLSAPDGGASDAYPPRNATWITAVIMVAGTFSNRMRTFDFPQDIQSVGVTLEPKVWSEAEVVLTVPPTAKAFIIDNDFEVSEWKVKSGDVLAFPHVYRGFGGKRVSRLRASVLLQREASYYMTRIVSNIVLLVLLTLIAGAMRPMTPDRFMVAVTCFMAIISWVFVLTADSPKTGTLSRLDSFINVSFGTVFFLAFFSAVNYLWKEFSVKTVKQQAYSAPGGGIGMGMGARRGSYGADMNTGALRTKTARMMMGGLGLATTTNRSYPQLAAVAAAVMSSKDLLQAQQQQQQPPRQQRVENLQQQPTAPSTPSAPLSRTLVMRPSMVPGTLASINEAAAATANNNTNAQQQQQRRPTRASLASMVLGAKGPLTSVEQLKYNKSGTTGLDVIAGAGAVNPMMARPQRGSLVSPVAPATATSGFSGLSDDGSAPPSPVLTAQQSSGGTSSPQGSSRMVFGATQSSSSAAAAARRKARASSGNSHGSGGAAAGQGGLELTVLPSTGTGTGIGRENSLGYPGLQRRSMNEFLLAPAAASAAEGELEGEGEGDEHDGEGEGMDEDQDAEGDVDGDGVASEASSHSFGDLHNGDDEEDLKKEIRVKSKAALKHHHHQHQHQFRMASMGSGLRLEGTDENEGGEDDEVDDGMDHMGEGEDELEAGNDISVSSNGLMNRPPAPPRALSTRISTVPGVLNLPAVGGAARPASFSRPPPVQLVLDEGSGGKRLSALFASPPGAAGAAAVVSGSESARRLSLGAATRESVNPMMAALGGSNAVVVNAALGGASTSTSPSPSSAHSSSRGVGAIASSRGRSATPTPPPTGCCAKALDNCARNDRCTFWFAYLWDAFTFSLFLLLCCGFCCAAKWDRGRGPPPCCCLLDPHHRRFYVKRGRRMLTPLGAASSGSASASPSSRWVSRVRTRLAFITGLSSSRAVGNAPLSGVAEGQFDDDETSSSSSSSSSSASSGANVTAGKGAARVSMGIPYAKDAVLPSASTGPTRYASTNSRTAGGLRTKTVSRSPGAANPRLSRRSSVAESVRRLQSAAKSALAGPVTFCCGTIELSFLEEFKPRTLDKRVTVIVLLLYSIATGVIFLRPVKLSTLND